MRWGVGVEHVYAYDLVIGARGQVLVVAGEADGVDSARMGAEGGELLGLLVLLLARVEDGFDGPYADVGIWRKL
jgi:hypothetical protein